MNRRKLLSLLAISTASISNSVSGRGIDKLLDELIESEDVVLNFEKVRMKLGVDIGCAIPKGLEQSGDILNKVKNEFSICCPEYNLNWSEDFDENSIGFNIVNDLNKHGMKIRGHTLYYYQNLPIKIRHRAASFGAAQLGDLIYKDVFDRVKRYKNKVAYWVINETFDGATKGRTLRKDPVVSKLGINLFEILISAAKDADENTGIELNDYLVERNKGYWAGSHYLTIAEALDKKSLKFDRIGFQCHVDWLPNGKSDFSPDAILATVAKLSQLNVDFAVTELDVDDRSFNGNESEREVFVASAYFDAVNRLKNMHRLVEVSMWSPFDQFNWIRRGNKLLEGTGKNSVSRCGLFDEGLRRKLSYYAVCKALLS